jgi:hypothetical protein
LQPFVVFWQSLSLSQFSRPKGPRSGYLKNNYRKLFIEMLIFTTKSLHKEHDHLFKSSLLGLLYLKFGFFRLSIPLKHFKNFIDKQDLIALRIKNWGACFWIYKKCLKKGKPAAAFRAGKSGWYRKKNRSAAPFGTRKCSLQSLKYKKFEGKNLNQFELHYKNLQNKKDG